jgi:hypothetical protein
MATNQQHKADIPSTGGLTIDEIPTATPSTPERDMSQKDISDANREKSKCYTILLKT